MASPPTNSTTLTRESQSSTSKSSFQKYLTNCRSLYSCIYCRTHLANHDELVSRSFQGSHGRAYLFKSVINVSCGPAVQRDLNTGPHAVADIFCADCERTLGWKYEKAYVESQKYKEGKYIIELAHVVRENRHLELDKGEIYFSRNDKYRTSSMQDSLKPPSPSHHSPSSNNYFKEETVPDDEELMFPLYEDLLACRSSNLSLSHHQRMRRSLYLDSTPYDWKYSTSTSSSSARQTVGMASATKIASSLDSSSDLSPSKSSSSDNSLECGQMSYHISNIKHTTNKHDSPLLGKRYKDQGVSDGIHNVVVDDDEEDDNGQEDDNVEEDEDETQFEFEEDKPHSSMSVNAQDKQCDQLDVGSVIVVQGSSELKENMNDNDDKNGNATVGTRPSAGASDNESSFGSIILDDETFYDCFTEHGLANATSVVEESSLTLKQQPTNH